jgi:TctA family transporter
MLIGNVMLLIINLPLVGIWVKLLRVPYHLLYPMILAIMCIGTYTMNNSMVDVLILITFGFFGYVFIKLRCEPAPLILALVLQPILEQSFQRALQVSYGNPSIFVTRPISLALIITTLIILSLMILPAIRSTREKAFEE